MTNPIGPVRRSVARRLPPVAAARTLHVLARGLSAVAAWARLGSGSLRLDEADVVAVLDRQGRALLWPVLSDTIATIGMLDAADAPVEAELATLAALADRVRENALTSPPPPEGAEPAHFFVLEILIRDLQPCLARWQPRLEAWRDAGRPAAEWPLTRLCRTDLARTGERLVERAWQLGMGLGLSGLDRLLPARPAMTPALVASAELAAAEAAAASRPDPASLRAGWQIYVEAATRLPATAFASGPGAIGAAIGALDALAIEIGAVLKTMPPPRPNGAPDTIARLAFCLLTESLQPFLAEWQPRYQRFAATGRPEAKWRRAEGCRTALAAARDRCLQQLRMLGVKIGAPPLPPSAAVAVEEDEPPLQLPAPATRP